MGILLLVGTSRDGGVECRTIEVRGSTKTRPAARAPDAKLGDGALAPVVLAS
jgi:hypothetical protein